MLFGVHLKVQIVARDREGFAIERRARQNTTTEDTEEAQWLQEHTKLHLWLDASSAARRWRTISYKTTAAATETFREGTLPSMGMETRKSHFRLTRSCRPLPSPPRTRAQSIL